VKVQPSSSAGAALPLCVVTCAPTCCSAAAAGPACLLLLLCQIVFEEFGFASFLEAPAAYFSLQYACTLPALQPDVQPPGEQ
jgi:hypothetical protein